MNRQARATTKELWSFLEKRVFPVSSTETRFNQYEDTILDLDKPNAAEIRRENLRKYVESQNWQSTHLIVGEAPGPWGCRFSGVPFTSEAQLLKGELSFCGKQSSKNNEPYSAKGAEVFWKVMLPYHRKGVEFFVWDCVPFHPHYEGKPLAPIRAPTSSELHECSDILLDIIRITKPQNVVAVGRKAERALATVNIKSEYVRHPSRGGARAFKKGMISVFKSHERRRARWKERMLRFVIF